LALLLRGFNSDCGSGACADFLGDAEAFGKREGFEKRGGREEDGILGWTLDI